MQTSGPIQPKTNNMLPKFCRNFAEKAGNYPTGSCLLRQNKMKLTVSKIRGVTSYGMLCSESELNLSDESEGITELKQAKYSSQIGKKFIESNSENEVK